MLHVDLAISATLEEYRHATMYPNVYPCAKTPLISAFRRGGNGFSHDFEADTEVQRAAPAIPPVSECRIEQHANQRARNLNPSVIYHQRPRYTFSGTWFRVKVPTRGQFKHAMEAQQRAQPRLRSPSTTPNPLYGCFVLATQKHSVPHRGRAFDSRRRDENPLKNNHVQQLEIVHWYIVLVCNGLPRSAESRDRSPTSTSHRQDTPA